MQETAAIEGLLVDLDKAGMPEALAAINLTEVVAALKEKNKQYATLTEQRANAKADDPVESAKKIRLRMDEEYDEMSTYAFAQSVVKPTQETAAFINRLNALVDETNALYNQRIAQARPQPPRNKKATSPLPTATRHQRYKIMKIFSLNNEARVFYRRVSHRAVGNPVINDY